MFLFKLALSLVTDIYSLTVCIREMDVVFSIILINVEECYKYRTFKNYCQGVQTI